jgi:preprotein translocase SecE subunit
MTTQQSTADHQQIPSRSSGGMGLARWVQMAFMAFAALLLMVFDKTITIIWDKFAEPEPLAVTALAAVLSAVVTVVLYRQKTISRVANEIVGELAKVDWPTREEVRVSTIVVLITSFLAACIVGTFDAAWSWITDFIYKV